MKNNKHKPEFKKSTGITLTDLELSKVLGGMESGEARPINEWI